MTQPEMPARLNLRMRERILQMAMTLFVKKGFSGVSLGDIAKKLKINQSLIYHYFTSKEELWNEVKKLLHKNEEEERVEVVPLSGIGLRRFLENYLENAIDFWFRNNAAARFSRWDSLEGAERRVKHGTDPLSIAFEELKSQGLVATAIEPEIAATLVRSAARGPFFSGLQSNRVLKTASARQAYMRLAAKSLESILSPP